MIYGAGGHIGSVVAREGAQVYLAGRTQAKLDDIADDFCSNGGDADTAVLILLNALMSDE